MANNTFQAVATIGYPESRIILSQCAVYLATSPKSNASYMAIGEAQAVVKQTGDLPVPIHLRNAPTKLMKELGYGDEYQYSHNYANNFSEQEFYLMLLKKLNSTIQEVILEKMELENFSRTVGKISTITNAQFSVGSLKLHIHFF